MDVATLIITLWLFGEPLVVKLPATSMRECEEEVMVLNGKAISAYCEPAIWPASR